MSSAPAVVPSDDASPSGALGALGAAWRRTKRDPFGVLLPAGGALVLQALAVQVWWRLDLDVVSWVAAGLGLVVATGVVTAPFRALILGAGARAGGRTAPGVRRSLSLVGVVLLVEAVHAVALLGLGALWLLGAGLLLSYGFASAGALFGAVMLVAAVGVSFGLRVRLAYAPVLAVDGGQAAWRAVLLPDDVAWGRTAAVVLGADLMLAFGTVLAGAGALPGYALRDLAVQRLWEDLS